MTEGSLCSCIASSAAICTWAPGTEPRPARVVLPRHLKPRLLKLNWRWAGIVATPRSAALRPTTGRASAHARHSERRCAPAAGAEASEAPRSPRALGISTPRARNRRRLRPLHGDPEADAQVQSPNLSLPSCFRLKKQKQKHKGKEGSSEVGRGKRRFSVNCQSEWASPVSSHHPREGARQTPLGPGRDTRCGWVTSEARGRRSCPHPHPTPPPFPGLADRLVPASCPSLTRTSAASSLHSSGAKSDRGVKHARPRDAEPCRCTLPPVTARHARTPGFQRATLPSPSFIIF